MTFREELEQIINRSSLENGSDSPDFVLAEFLIGCLNAFDNAVNLRERWYGRERSIKVMEQQWPASLNEPPSD